ncbi:MAG: pilus assembly protein PilP [Nitrospira sp.]|nr:pilus assembly protein PilP [Nitrospira sp.]
MKFLKIQDSRCRMQDKSPHPPFSKGGQGGITKKLWYHGSCILNHTSFLFLQLAILIIFLIIPLTGCKKEQPVGKKPVVQQVQPAQPEPKVEQPAEVKKVEEEIYTYETRGRRDPFLSIVLVSKQKPSKKKGASPVESYGVDTIELLAIAWDKNKRYALITLPDKKSYTISEGMTLGLHDGKVQQITKNTVVIREYIKDYRGDIKPVDIVLKLRREEGE